MRINTQKKRILDFFAVPEQMAEIYIRDLAMRLGIDLDLPEKDGQEGGRK